MNQGVTFLSELNGGENVNQSIDDFLSVNKQEEKVDEVDDDVPSPKKHNPDTPLIPLTDDQIYEYLNRIGNSDTQRRHYYEDTCDEGHYHISKCKRCRHNVCGRDYSFNSNMILYAIIAVLFVMVIILLCKK